MTANALAPAVIDHVRIGATPIGMALDIQEREREGIVSSILNGRLIVGEPVSSLREKVRELIR